MDLAPTEAELAQAGEAAKDSFIDIPNPAGGTMPLVVVCRANTDTSEREENVRINNARGLKRFLHRPDLRIVRDDPIAIVAGGPSVADYLGQIRNFRYIMAAGSTHDFLLNHGIIPTFAVAADSKPETNDFYQNLREDVDYLMASTIHPGLIDRLEEHCRDNTYIWNFHDQVDPEHYADEDGIGFGCMVGVTCIQMALWLGFQQQHYFGYDCSFAPNYRTHAYMVGEEERKGLMEQVTEATVGPEGNKFLTTTALLLQAQHIFAVYGCPDGQYLRGHVYGNGLLHDQIRQSPPEMKEWLEAV